MRNKKSRHKREANFVVQGSILAVAGIIVRLIGILYRVPMTNIIGDEGMGYYSTAFNVYNILLILSSYSLPTAVSKMVSARIAKGQYRNSVRVLKTALIYATVAGGIACAVTWNFAGFFATTVFDTPFSIYALKTLAPTVWIMAYLGVLRGYFQGHGTMVPTAISQIFEQVINAVISVTAAGLLFKIGFDSNMVYATTGYPEAFGAAGGTIGTGAGAMAAITFMIILFLLYRPTMKRQSRRDKSRRLDHYSNISATFFMTVIPVIISSVVYNISSIIDNSIMAYGMSSLGQGKEFLSLWGIYNNKYLLLVRVPLAMASALAASLIPSLSAAVARKERRSVISKTGLVVRFAMLIAIPSAVGLAVLAVPIHNLLFHNGSNAEAVKMMLVGSSAVVFLSLSTVTNAILQGINRLNIPVRNAFISLILHIIALYVMLMVMHLGIYSVLYANLLFAVFMCLLNAWSIRRYLRYRQEMTKTFILPAVAALIMGAAAFLVYQVVHRLVHSNLIGTVLAIFVSAAVYGTLLLRLHCVEEDELFALPGGGRVIRIARRMRLL